MKIRNIRLLFVLAFIVTLSSCALSPKSLLESYPKNSKVLFLSVMGDNFNIVVKGTTALNDEARVIELPQWQVDAIVEEQVIDNTVKNKSKFAFEKMKKQGVSKLYKEDIFGGLSPKGLLENAQSTGADFLVVLFPGWLEHVHNDFVERAESQYLGGYGITQISKLGDVKSTSLYASAEIYVYRLSDLKLVGKTGNVGTFWLKDLHKKPFDEITEEDLSSHKELLTTMLVRKTKVALTDMGFCNCF